MNRECVASVQMSYYERVDIVQSECVESPREWSNLGEMFTWHRNYKLGEKSNVGNPSEFDPAEQWGKDGIWLPLYLYDHSGLTINTTGFHCPWDSGQIGWIGVSREKIGREFIIKKGETEKKIRARALKCLKGEVKVFDQYLRGDVYGFIHMEKGKKDSCFGFFGTDWKNNGLLDEIFGNDKKKARLFLSKLASGQYSECVEY